MPVKKVGFDKGVLDISPDTKGSAPKVGDVNLSNPDLMQQSISNAVENSNGALNSDAMKYATAYKLASNRLAGYEDVDDQRLKDEVDYILENELGAEEGAGRKARGENAFTDAIGGIKDFINGTNVAIGNGMDWLWDNIVGNAAGFIAQDDGVRETVQNAFNGEDLAIIPDIAEDALLAIAGGPVGLGLAAAKNLVQQSDNIAEAISGKDNVSQETLNEWQRAGKTIEGLGGAALSVLPGLGATKHLSKYVKGMNKLKEASKAAESTYKEAKSLADNAESMLNSLDNSKLPFSDRLMPDIATAPEHIPPAYTRFGAFPRDLENMALYEPKQFNIDEVISNRLKDFAPQKSLKQLRQEQAEAYGNLKEINQVVADNPDLRFIKNPALRWENYQAQVARGNDLAKQALKRGTKAERETADEAYKIAREELKEAKKTGSREDKRAAKDLVKEAQAKRKSLKSHPIQAYRMFTEGLNPLNNSLSNQLNTLETLAKSMNSSNKEKAVSALGNYAKRAGANAAAIAPMTIAHDLAENGNPQYALGNAMKYMAENPEAYLLGLAPVGAKGIARKVPSMSSKTTSNLLPYAMLRGGAMTDMMSNLDESYVPEGYSEEELVNRLNAIRLAGAE